MKMQACPGCNGDGVDMPAGSCGGGCDFCPPARRCEECKGTGEVPDNESCREDGCDEPSGSHGPHSDCIYCAAHCSAVSP